MRLGTIAFLIGIVIALQFTYLPDRAWSFWLFPLLIVLSRFPRISALTLLLCGVLWLSLRASILLDGTLGTQLEGKDAIIEGSIVSIPVRKQNSSRFIFEIDTMTVGDDAFTNVRQVRLSWYGGDSTLIASGQRWRLQVRMKRPYGSMNPGGFDYERWLFQQRINATGYVRNGKFNIRLADSSIINSFYQLRQHLYDRISSLIKDSEQMGLIQALALGERSQISRDQWQRLQDTGTSHLVAISGLHIGLVAAWVFFIVRWLWPRSFGAYLPIPAPQVAAVIAWCAALIYAAMAGFSIPTQRALIMITVVTLSVIIKRPIALSHVWALSLIAVLIYDPLAALSPGFWLSFAAVGVILYGLGNRLRSDSLWWRYGRVHVIVALGLIPLLVLLFQKVPVLSPIANFIAVPIVSLMTVPLILIALPFVDILPMVSEWLLRIAEYSLQILQVILVFLQPYSSVPMDMPEPTIFIVTSFVVGTLWLMVPNGWPARWLGVFGFLPLFFFSVDRPAHNAYWLSVLDVGQGTAIVVTTNSHNLVYDTGAKYSERFDMGRAVVLPYLNSILAGHIDVLVVSHEDNDHMGGAASILNEIMVNEVFSSVPERFNNENGKACIAGQSWNWDGVSFEFLHPDSDYVVTNQRRQRNNRSCVLRISNGVETVLLPGDIERHAERYLLAQQNNELSADIVVAPHHGSRTSSTKDFVLNIDPEYVVYTVGYRNRYGFPKSQVIKRYDELGAKAYRSDDSGALRFILDGDGDIAPPEEYRLQQRRFWHTIR